MIAPGARVADRFDLLRLEGTAPLYRAYSALELGAGREVTLWIPHAALLASPEARARFVDSARATRSADGAHLVRVIDAGVDPFLGAQEAAAVAGVGAARGGVWLSLQPTTGQTLAERIAKGRPAPDPVVAYLAQSLARAIDGAHAAGLVHGYLRAADVLMAGEWPRLSGVGLWAAVDRVAAIAALRADAHLLAPEVRGGEPPSRRADVYAMAVILAEVALGMAAESGAEAAVLRDRLRRERPRLEAALRPAFSALAAERPASATQLANELATMVPAAKSTRGTGEVRIGGQLVTPVVGTPTDNMPTVNAPMPTASTASRQIPRPTPGFGGAPAENGGSISAAILSVAEVEEDAEHAFDETGEFQTVPLPLVSPPPVPSAVPVAIEPRAALSGKVPAAASSASASGGMPRLTPTPTPFAASDARTLQPPAAVPSPRVLQTPPSFARSSGEHPVPVPAGTPAQERVAARGTMPPPRTTPPPMPAARPPQNLGHGSTPPPSPSHPGSARDGVPVLVLEPSMRSGPTPAAIAAAAAAIASTGEGTSPYEKLDIETGSGDVTETAVPVALPERLNSDPEAAIATAEFDADAATNAREAETGVFVSPAPPGSDPDTTPPGGSALPLPAPEVTGIRPNPLAGPIPDLSAPQSVFDAPTAVGPTDGVPEAPLVIGSTAPVRRYPTAQIVVGDSFAERALLARRQRLKVLAMVILMVLSAAAVVWWWKHARQAGRDEHPPAALPAPPPPRPAAPVPAAAPAPRTPCPKDMILIEGKERFCIDIDEATGPSGDHMPRVGVTLADAGAACAKIGKRLCEGREWEMACRGPNRASYPWGPRPSSSNQFCNLGPGRAIGAVGAFDKCVSASGARDMSGNVAEWVADGQLRGGSALVTGDGRCSRPLKAPADRPLDDVGFRCCADPAL